MRLVLSLLLLLFEVHTTSLDIHSLKYLYMAVSGDVDFPKFTAVGLVDGEEFIYFDSNTKEAIPKTEWIKQNTGADYWSNETERLIRLHQTFKSTIHTEMEQSNQSKSTGAVHTYQRKNGCEWDSMTGVLTHGFDEYGYDGEDYMSLDVKNTRYVPLVPEPLISKKKWDSDRKKLEHEKHDFNNNCVKWLKKYVRYGRSVPERTVSPQVSLLQRDPSSLVKCHVTGFYPRQVMIYWQKNGEDLFEDPTETMPNADGTFQKSSVLSVKPEEWKNNHDVYTCVVQHKSGEDIKKNLTEGEIKTNYGSNDMTKIITTVAVAAALVFIIIAIVVFCLWKRSKNGGEKKNDSPNTTGSVESFGSDSSEDTMLKP